MTKDIIERFEAGTWITTPELEELSQFFNKLKEDLWLMGPKYGLAYDAVVRNSERVTGYLEARNRKKNGN